jgi:hypothetical protein
MDFMRCGAAAKSTVRLISLCAGTAEIDPGTAKVHQEGSQIYFLPQHKDEAAAT